MSKLLSIRFGHVIQVIFSRITVTLKTKQFTWIYCNNKVQYIAIFYDIMFVWNFNNYCIYVTTITIVSRLWCKISCFSYYTTAQQTITSKYGLLQSCRNLSKLYFCGCDGNFETVLTLIHEMHFFDFFRCQMDLFRLMMLMI